MEVIVVVVPVVLVLVRIVEDNSLGQTETRHKQNDDDWQMQQLQQQAHVWAEGFMTLQRGGLWDDLIEFPALSTIFVFLAIWMLLHKLLWHAHGRLGDVTQQSCF